MSFFLQKPYKIYGCVTSNDRVSDSVQEDRPRCIRHRFYTCSSIYQLAATYKTWNDLEQYF